MRAHHKTEALLIGIQMWANSRSACRRALLAAFDANKKRRAGEPRLGERHGLQLRLAPAAAHYRDRRRQLSIASAFLTWMVAVAPTRRPAAAAAGTAG
jgi:hypothetical protein